MGGEMWPAGTRREAAGDRSASSVQERARMGGLDCRLGAGHVEERTLNMLSMFMTLDVSKLSGWLNANAPCRVERRGYAMRDEVRAGRREVL